MIIRIKNLRLRAIIGVYDWERTHAQDVVLNIEMDVDADRAAATDRIEDTADYKALCAGVIELVEQSRFTLLERLAGQVLAVVLADAKVRSARVEVDKPHALHFADSVSVEVRGAQPQGASDES